jgi:hypothetical protein
MLCTLLIWSRPLAAADKVDVIELKNGNRLTCEIKKLERGVLEASTDALGTVSVYWGEIAALESPREFDIQMSSGDRYLGSVRPAPPNQLIVATSTGPVTVNLSDLIRLAPIGSTIWNRVDGALDAGFSFAQANLETHATTNSTVGYRSSKHQLAVTYAAQVTTREDAERLFRSDLNLSGIRFLADRWYTIAWGAFEQNDELSLDLRTLAAGGFGRDLVHTNYRLWSLYSALAYTHEQFADEPSEQSAEVAVGTRLDFFTPMNDDFSLTNRVVSYFTIGRPRVRLELQSAWRHEFFKDFYWSLNGFDSFNSDPPSDEKTNDFGVSFTLGCKF